MFGDDDDDDDYLKRAAALAKEEKARKDREADEAFRKAAEPDCKLLLSFSDIQSINLFHSRKRTQTQWEEILVWWVAWRQERWRSFEACTYSRQTRRRILILL
jgi:hypothetical protein